MNIALTQREMNIKGWLYDCTSQDWYGFLNKHTLHFVPNTKDFDYTDIDCLLIPGGESTDNRDRIETFAIDLFLKRNKPIIGVCHGAFFLNRFYGGVNTSIEGHQGTNHSIKMEFKTHQVNSYHSASIETLADCLEPIAVDDNGVVEAFKHKELPQWGIVWHPERMETPVLPQAVGELLDA